MGNHLTRGTSNGSSPMKRSRWKAPNLLDVSNQNFAIQRKPRALITKPQSKLQKMMLAVDAFTSPICGQRDSIRPQIDQLTRAFKCTLAGII